MAFIVVVVFKKSIGIAKILGVMLLGRCRLKSSRLEYDFRSTSKSRTTMRRALI